VKRFIAGIDPDVDKAGFALWDRRDKKWVNVATMHIEDIEAALRNMEDLIVYVEAGWMNSKANYRRGHKSSVSEQIAMRVGMNHCASKIVARMLKKAGREVVEIPPLQKGFFKKDGSWTKIGKDYLRGHSGYDGKIVSGEICDALLIVMHYR